MTAPTETSVNQIAKEIMARAKRGHDLLLRKKQLITKTREDTYRVPSCTGKGTYIVRYGDGVESCTCTDYQVHRGGLSCKHLQAVGIMHAVRRRVNSTCQVCGASSREKTLKGRRGDRQRDAERWCLPHHPESMASFHTVLAPETSAGDPILAVAGGVK